MRALSSRPNGRQRAEKKRRRFAAVVEEMERRRLMTGAVDSVIFPATDAVGPAGITFDNGASIDWRSDGTVRVTGTVGDDTISVDQSEYRLFGDTTTYPVPYRISVNGQAVTLRSGGSFPQITRFEVEAGDGNDSVTITGAWLPVIHFMDADVARPYFGIVNPDPPSPSFLPSVSVSGGAGNDNLVARGGAGTLDGGTGVDHIQATSGSYQIITEPGISPPFATGRWDEIGGGAYVGVAGNSVVDIRGTEGNDVITVDWHLAHPGHASEPIGIVVNGVSYTNSLFGTLTYGGVTAFRIDGAGGDDALTVTGTVPYPATLLGGTGNDTLNGDASVDELRLNEGVVNPSRPVDRTLGATPFSVLLPGGGTIAWDPAGVLSVQGTAGNDSIYFAHASGGMWGAEQLVVTVNGDDWTFRTEPGVAVGHIEVDAGDGNDTVSTLSSPSYYFYDPIAIPYGLEDTAVLRLASISQIYYPIRDPGFDIPLLIRGGAGNDNLSGGGRQDTIYGGDGNDSLSSSYGGDELYGEAGNDALTANGAGGDSLYGGSGHDHLRQTTADNALLVLGDPGDPPLPEARGEWYEFGDGVLANIADDGTLSIRGTDHDDVITVSQSPGLYFEGPPIEVTANGVTWQVSGWIHWSTWPYISFFSSVAGIHVDAGGGNDHVTAGPGLRVPTTVDGGSGDDVLEVRHPLAAPVTLIGGDGADTLAGDAGTDYVVIPADSDLGPPIWDPPLPPVILPVDPPIDMPSPAPPVGNGAPEVRTLVFDAPLRKAVTKAGTRAFFDDGASALWRTDGVLIIRGTSEDDLIRVARTGKGKNATMLVKINAVTRAFRVGSAIRRVEIDAGDGDDAVLLGGSDLAGSVFAAIPLDVPAVVAGGRGNDTLVGGSKADVLRGNAGRDSLEGGGGNDLLYGGVGDDTLAGGAGRDRVDDVDLDLFRGIEGVIV